MRRRRTQIAIVLTGLWLAGGVAGALAQSNPAATSAPQPQDATVTAAPVVSDLPTVFHVKYVAQATVYLDGGHAAGLAQGMKLAIKRPSPAESTSSNPAPEEPAVVAQLVVVSVAETSAVCDVQPPDADIHAGDVAYLSKEDTEALAEQHALGRARAYPIVVSFSEGDTLEEEARDEVPRPPLPEVNRARGRIGFDYSSIRSTGIGGGSSSYFGVVLRADVTRIGGTYWNLSGYWRGKIEEQSSTAQPTLQDLINRTYHLSLTYDNPRSHWVAGFGRLYLPWAASLDTIDGGYFGRRLSRTATAGFFAGSTPDPTSWNYNPNRRIAGTFVNFEGGSFDNIHYTSTSGVAISTLGWKIDRPFVFFENGVSYKHFLSIYHSLQADAPRGTSQVAAPGAGISRSYLTVRIQPTPRLAFDFNHNYFRDVPTFDPNLVATGLVDKLLFQGLSVGVRAEPVRHYFFYVNVGRSDRTGDARPSLNQLYGFTVDHIWRTGLRADVRYSKFDSSFGRGAYRALSLSRNLGENMRFEVQAGGQSLVSTFTNLTSSRFLMASVDTNLGSHYFLQGGFTAQRGLQQAYNQWFITMGYRFDNRTHLK
jgi:hypothetical protein